MLWAIQLTPNASLNPHDNSKNRHEGPRDRGMEAPDVKSLDPQCTASKRWAGTLGRKRGLLDVEACILSASPRRSWLSFNGWCPAPGPQSRGIKAVCSPGRVSGVSTMKTAASQGKLQFPGFPSGSSKSKSLAQEHFRQPSKVAVLLSPSVRVLRIYFLFLTLR